MHSTGGFKQNFSWAKRICRMATVSSLQISYCRDKCELWTAAEHERQCMHIWSDENLRNMG